ncbi:Ubiquitin carboxyl-terminal hydrolase 20 [Bulinus truncatus]|nr:Ubiquitin carboxyl-terminal hydrolase 20 [Bulinus truncatus]
MIKGGSIMSAAEGSPQKNMSGNDSDSDYEQENIRPRGLTGLQNLGNTCYLNSAFQSLSNCPPLTRYFLDCSRIIRQDKSPYLAKNYSKLINELWHKKRPSYVVPSGVVSGIKSVHPMFKGYTQQDAQEFLRCLMDQLHEELKVPYSDDSDSDEDDNTGARGDDDDGSNNASTSNPAPDHKAGTCVSRRPSFDSMSSQSEELDYETCDSGLSSEQSSSGGQDNGSSDENEELNESTQLRKPEASRKSLDTSSPLTDLVANTKEKKETANLLEKKNEADSVNRRLPCARPVMEGGDSRELGSSTFMPVPVKDGEGTSQSSHQHQKQLPVHPAKAKKIRYESIISQTFDGKILSSVRCLNCNTVSTTKETFQDLSLPIPSKDHLHMLHAGYPAGGGVAPPKGGTCGEVNQGWIAWMYSWMKSWIVGPTITLQDCLLAFFSADELKGDNMYSCEKCKKLRNGLKYSKVLKLPEILSIHLKRFRHEFYSSKIGTYISFPLEGLDMEPYLHRGNIIDSKFHKGCKDEVTLYDLVAIICHHGTAGGGHYTAYCLNHLNDQWYEFDDQYVTEVDISQVQNCEAYVLFYRKSNKNIESIRQKVLDLEQREVSLLKFYISKQWLCRFQTFAEPGPISNKDFLCKHGGMPPGKFEMKDDLSEEIPQAVWEILYSRFGGGPVCNHLYPCQICQSEHEKLEQRQRNEKETFSKLHEEFQEKKHATSVYAISMSWVKEWEDFVKKRTQIPPGPIENSRITVYKNSQPTLRHTSEYAQISRDMWLFLHQIYGGGPELIICQSAGQPSSGASVRSVPSSPVPPPTNQSLGPGAVTSSSTSPTLSRTASSSSATWTSLDTKSPSVMTSCNQTNVQLPARIDTKETSTQSCPVDKDVSASGDNMTEKKVQPEDLSAADKNVPDQNRSVHDQSRLIEDQNRLTQDQNRIVSQDQNKSTQNLCKSLQEGRSAANKGEDFGVSSGPMCNSTATLIQSLTDQRSADKASLRDVDSIETAAELIQGSADPGQLSGDCFKGSLPDGSCGTSFSESSTALADGAQVCDEYSPCDPPTVIEEAPLPKSPCVQTVDSLDDGTVSVPPVITTSGKGKKKKKNKKMNTTKI